MLVRGKTLVADPARPEATIQDGAVLVRDDTIVAVGQYGELVQRYAQEKQIGSQRHLVLPGLINAHDHGRGVSAYQLGVPDDRVEFWLADLLRMPNVDPYLATAYASIQFIESGVTTTQHSFYHPDPGTYERVLAESAQAYADAGLGAVLRLGVLEKSPITTLCEDLLPHLPASLRRQARSFLDTRTTLSVDDYFAIFRGWQRAHKGTEAGRITIQLGPVSTHWCSDALLVRIRDEAERWQTSIQTHLLETVHQRRGSLKNGIGEVQRLAAIGFLSPLLSCAHCVWVDDEGIDLLAQHGTTVVHNASSNLRLGSGLAPVSRMLEKGVNVALGLDSNGLNDEGDMLQEMRLVANLHRGPGTGSTWPTSRQILSMATQNGARALTLDREVGVLEEGKKADLILLRLDEIERPYVDPRHDVVDTLLYRAKANHVDTVMIDGKLVMEHGSLLSIDKEMVTRELRSQLKAASDESMAWLRQLKPYAARLYGAESGWPAMGSLYESDRN